MAQQPTNDKKEATTDEKVEQPTLGQQLATLLELQESRASACNLLEQLCRYIFVVAT